MCGITGYIGPRDGLRIAFDNLCKLEYRGYDSAGVFYFVDDKGAKKPIMIKRRGKLAVLNEALQGKSALPQTAAIAHTRWATHGVPNEMNAHPHCDCAGEIFLVHNGIIENYRELKESLEKRGHKFVSETDTEIVAHVIEEELKKINKFEIAFKKALRRIRGAYALAVVYTKDPDHIYFARLGSPLVLGIGEGEYFLASDPTALAGLVNKVLYVEDGAYGRMGMNEINISTKKKEIVPLEVDAERIQKGDFSHFMLKEIFESSEVVRAATRGRLDSKRGRVRLGGLLPVEEKLKTVKRFEIVSCGTSYHAALIGKRLFEEYCGMPVTVWLASEYRYAEIPREAGTVSIFISQSGETADTLAALHKAKSSGYTTLGIVNVVGSSIARETDAGVYNHAGPEISVASTKAFVSQLAVLMLMTGIFVKKINSNTRALLKALGGLDKKIERIVTQSDHIKTIAEKYKQARDFIYLGRGYNFPVALEGALKLKEISYIHAEGFAGGELKHGPIALIDEHVPTIVLATKNSLQEKIISNIEEIKARGGPVIAVMTEGDRRIKELADAVIEVPKIIEALESIVNVIPLQLFAYHMAVARGKNVDQPRNLAKSVTVE